MAATQHAQTIKKDTQECLTIALLQLLEHHQLSDLSVSKVCQRAGVSRMAFYRNFEQLDQIIYAYYQPKIADEFERLRHTSQNSVKLENQEEFFAVFGEQLIRAKAQGFEPLISQIFTEEIKKFFINQNKDEEWLTFISAGVYALWSQWLLSGRKRPLSEIHELIRKMVTA